MEIFITLTKFNTCQEWEEGKLMLVVYYLINILTLLTIVSNVFMRNEIYPLMFICMVYNITPDIEITIKINTYQADN